MFRVRCDHPAGCAAEADALQPIGRLNNKYEEEYLRDNEIAIVQVPQGWTSNYGLGGTWRHYCPDHPQPEISGG